MPRSNQGFLREWDYFPKDVDTADLSSVPWWDALNDAIAKTVAELKPRCGLFTSRHSKTFPDEYFAQLVRSGAVATPEIERH